MRTQAQENLIRDINIDLGYRVRLTLIIQAVFGIAIPF